MKKTIFSAIPDDSGHYQGSMIDQRYAPISASSLKRCENEYELSKRAAALIPPSAQGIMPGTTTDRFGKNWSPEEERILLDAYRIHGPNWPTIEALLPLRKGITSKWKRLVATGNQEAIETQRWWRMRREQMAAEAAAAAAEANTLSSSSSTPAPEPPSTAPDVEHPIQSAAALIRKDLSTDTAFIAPTYAPLSTGSTRFQTRQSASANLTNGINRGRRNADRSSDLHFDAGNGSFFPKDAHPTRLPSGEILPGLLASPKVVDAKDRLPGVAGNSNESTGIPDAFRGNTSFRRANAGVTTRGSVTRVGKSSNWPEQHSIRPQNKIVSLPPRDGKSLDADIMQNVSIAVKDNLSNDKNIVYTEAQFTLKIPVPKLPCELFMDAESAQQWIQEYAHAYAEQFSHEYASAVMSAYIKGTEEYIKYDLMHMTNEEKRSLLIRAQQLIDSNQYTKKRRIVPTDGFEVRESTPRVRYAHEEQISHSPRVRSPLSTVVDISGQSLSTTPRIHIVTQSNRNSNAADEETSKSQFSRPVRPSPFASNVVGKPSDDNTSSASYHTMVAPVGSGAISETIPRSSSNTPKAPKDASSDSSGSESSAQSQPDSFSAQSEIRLPISGDKGLVYYIGIPSAKSSDTWDTDLSKKETNPLDSIMLASQEIEKNSLLHREAPAVHTHIPFAPAGGTAGSSSTNDIRIHAGTSGPTTDKVVGSEPHLEIALANGDPTESLEMDCKIALSVLANASADANSPIDSTSDTHFRVAEEVV